MASGGRTDTGPSPSASPTWNRSRLISSTRQIIIRNLATRKRFVKFSNATGSSSTNAMSGIETPMGRTPFQGASLNSASPRAKAPDFAKPTSRLAVWRHIPQHEGRHSFSDGGLGYSVRPLRGHTKMSKPQRGPRAPSLQVLSPNPHIFHSQSQLERRNVETSQQVCRKFFQPALRHRRNPRNRRSVPRDFLYGAS